MRTIQCFVGYRGYTVYELIVSLSRLLSTYNKRGGHLRLAERMLGRPNEDISESNFGAYAQGKKARFNRSWLDDYGSCCGVEEMLSIMNNSSPAAGWENRVEALFRGFIQAAEAEDCEQTEDYLRSREQIMGNCEHLVSFLKAILNGGFASDKERKARIGGRPLFDAAVWYVRRADGRVGR